MPDDSPAAPSDPPEQTPDGNGEAQLPDAFVERLRKMMAPADFDEAARSFSITREVGFRINTLSEEIEPVVTALRGSGLTPSPVSWLPSAYTIPAAQRDRLLETPTYLERRIYVQNLASMIPPVVLEPEPGEEILDLTAAPGSKTHQMACIMRNTGRITAVESVRTRYYKLRDNMEKLGAECVRPFFQDGTRTWRHRPAFYDRVLLDAPCSSEGRFRLYDPDTMRYWSLRKVTEMSRKQRRLLYSAIKCLKVGGTLVYSTCSFSPEENEAVVSRFLSKFSGAIRVVPIELKLPQFRPGLTEWQGREFAAEMGMARRVVPDGAMDGFFVCKLEKTAATDD